MSHAQDVVNRQRETGWDESRFEEIFLDKYPRIVSVLLRLLGDRVHAEELANEVFCRLYRQPELCGSERDLGAWLYRTATNIAIDALRSSMRRQRYEQAAARHMIEAADGPDPLNDVLRDETCRRVRAVLGSLKPAQAQILVLRSSGFSYNELAEILGVKQGSVGTMLARAEAEFRKSYIDKHGKEEAL